jgi:hypothetical protein
MDLSRDRLIPEFFRPWRWRRYVPPKRRVDTKRTTRRYIPEDGTLHNHRCENLKSYILYNLNQFCRHVSLLHTVKINLAFLKDCFFVPLRALLISESADEASFRTGGPHYTQVNRNSWVDLLLRERTLHELCCRMQLLPLLPLWISNWILLLARKKELRITTL